MMSYKREENPLVTILLPVYNGERFLREAIDSVLEQTYANLEVLIINDGSTDSTEEIIFSYKDPRIRYVKNETNLRLISTLNKGIMLAKGELIARMDADDVCYPERIEKQVAYMRHNPDVSVCGTWAIIIDSRGERIGRIKNIDNGDLVSCVTLFSTPFVHPTVMFRRNVIMENLYNPGAINMEDVELWQRLTRQGYRLTNIPRYLLAYRQHRDNISKNAVQETRERELGFLGEILSTFIGRNASRKELELHKLTYRLFGSKEYLPEEMRKKMFDERAWLETLSVGNIRLFHMQKSSLVALLFSRWVVCCIFTKRFWQIPLIRLPYYHPMIFFKAIKLLLYNLYK